MKLLAVTALGLALMNAPVFAAGDVAAGETGFRKCKACHAITDAEGTKIVKGGRTGPDLYGIYKRVAGSTDFKYGDSMVQAGEAGLIWEEEAFVSYVSDPKKFLVEHNDDKRAKSKMSFKLKKPEDAANIWAYLVSVGPEAPAEAN